MNDCQGLICKTIWMNRLCELFTLIFRLDWIIIINVV